ncbi:MAG: DegT/DnrJ/EryC1/StrS family aminotransferase [Chloroflexota bacterium]
MEASMISGRGIAMRECVLKCERRIAELGARRGSVLTSRATTGLAIALAALGPEKGSGVVLPVMVCATVVYAVKGAGMRPVFADVEAQEGGIGISLAAARRCLEKDGKCSALLAIPLFGGEVDRDGLSGLASEFGLLVVEDAAQAGLVRKQKGFGACSVVSFGRGKVGAAGTGGAVLSDDVGLLERVRTILGVRHEHEARMAGVAGVAAKVLIALEGLEAEVEGRLRMAEEYRRRLGQEGAMHIGKALPVWKYSVLVRDQEARDRITRALLERAIEATNLYPPLTRWFAGVEGEEYEGAKGLYDRIVNLPLWSDEGMGERAQLEEWSERTLEAVEGVFAEVR